MELPEGIQINHSSRNHNSVDKALCALVAIPERTNIELGITLSVGGLIISGYLVSEEAYFLQMMDIIGRTKAEADVRDTLKDFLDQLRKGLKAKDDDEKIRMPQFVHLRSAKMYPSQGHGMPTQGQALWRGRISSVDGFSLGEMISTNFEDLGMTPNLKI
ncbi:hypothetical protein C7271_24235 [filamentous cyanobacterium CCP5]|nr:hypothetical protein C7271_24235 [filamentous cyanobacterium CCP5]